MTEELKIVRFRPINEFEKAADLDPLWGNWIFRPCVIFQVGEPGIYKTSFNYSFVKAIVDNKEFLGVKPVEPNLRVLYLDWESGDSLIKSRMRTMGYPTNTKNFMVYNDPEFTLKAVDRAVEQGKLKFDMVFVDPIRLAFATRDENDNAEAAQQAKYVRELSQRWNCAIIEVHHAGKAELTGTRKGSGAFARASLADICMNFESLGEGYSRDIFRIAIAKNRLIDDDFLIFVKKQREDRSFEVTDPPLGYSIAEGYEASTKLYSVQQRIETILSPHIAMSPQHILNELGGDTRIQAVYNCLGNLITLGIAEREGYGAYRKNKHQPDIM